MKILLLPFFLFLCVCIQAQSPRFAQAMKSNLDLMDSAKTDNDYKTVADNFERIGDAEKKQWLPYYYAGLTLCIDGWKPDTKVDKDQNASRVKQLCDKAAAIHDNAEIYVLRNMAATQQMLVDPPGRWQTYGKEAHEALQKGLQLDPNNPRLYYLQGASLFNTPEQFGGGKAKARPVLEKALQLFDSAKVSGFEPQWGKRQTEEMLAQCK